MSARPYPRAEYVCNQCKKVFQYKWIRDRHVDLFCKQKPVLNHTALVSREEAMKKDDTFDDEGTDMAGSSSEAGTPSQQKLRSKRVTAELKKSPSKCLSTKEFLTVLGKSSSVADPSKQRDRQRSHSPEVQNLLDSLDVLAHNKKKAPSSNPSTSSGVAIPISNPSILETMLAAIGKNKGSTPTSRNKRMDRRVRRKGMADSKTCQSSTNQNHHQIAAEDTIQQEFTCGCCEKIPNYETLRLHQELLGKAGLSKDAMDIVRELSTVSETGPTSQHDSPGLKSTFQSEQSTSKTTNPKKFLKTVDRFSHDHTTLPAGPVAGKSSLIVDQKIQNLAKILLPLLRKTQQDAPAITKTPLQDSVTSSIPSTSSVISPSPQSLSLETTPAAIHNNKRETSSSKNESITVDFTEKKMEEAKDLSAESSSVNDIPTTSSSFSPPDPSEPSSSSATDTVVDSHPKEKRGKKRHIENDIEDLPCKKPN